MFTINIEKLHWISGNEDDPRDLCLHGVVSVNIGKEFFKESCTVSATALYLLRSVKENHITEELEGESQMLPCCGILVSDEDNTSVIIVNCLNGVDWTVIHNDNLVNITTESGTEAIVNIEDYKKTVFEFADKIENFYKKSSPKIFEDDFNKNAYIAFWNEWKKFRSL